MDRRSFIKKIGFGATAIGLSSSSFAHSYSSLSHNQSVSGGSRIKPISGSWFEFNHPGGKEGVNWDGDLKKFTTNMWRDKVFEIRETGMEYLVLMNMAVNGKAYYDTALAPKIEMACDDPLEAVLSAADECGIRFFVSNGFWGDDLNAVKMMTDKDIARKRNRAMEEIWARYGHHKSFYGWYFANECWLDPYFGDFVAPYVNESSYVAKSLNPASVNLIAPYNIKRVKFDDTFIRQLENLNIDIIAYQDGVGVNSTKLEDSEHYFEQLYLAHQKASRSRIWADMELFSFEQTTHGSLIPADFNGRILKQMEAISPYVDKILVYQYLGIMNKPFSKAPAGLTDVSEKLYTDYMEWYNKQNF